MVTEHEKPYLTCREVLDFLVDYSDGQLGDAARREFDRHLDVCPSCVAYVKSYQTTIELEKLAAADSVAGCGTGVPESLIKAILAARAAGRAQESH